MQTESTPPVRSIVPTFPETPFSFRQLIVVRPWHAIAPANEAAIRSARCRQARPKPAGLRRLAFLGLLGVFLSIGATVRAGQSVSISWNPTTNTATAGYMFFRGTNSGVYASQYNVGTNTVVTFTGLPEGQMDYFAVAAYDSAGVLGPYSTQVTYLVPGLVKLAPPAGPGKAGSVTFSAAIGHAYTVQASTNLTSWTNVWSSGTVTSNAWITWQDPQSTTLAKRFYRLVMQ